MHCYFTYKSKEMELKHREQLETQCQIPPSDTAETKQVYKACSVSSITLVVRVLYGSETPAAILIAWSDTSHTS